MRVLLSVYDKTGLVALAEGLTRLGHELIASGGTADALETAGIDHTTVESVTAAPEMLSGRVKTLHPKIHGGILADRSNRSHLADLEAQGIKPIDLVVCNLYPFRDDPSVDLIDVGGPTMAASLRGLTAFRHYRRKMAPSLPPFISRWKRRIACGTAKTPTSRERGTGRSAATAGGTTSFSTAASSCPT